MTLLTGMCQQSNTAGLGLGSCLLFKHRSHRSFCSCFPRVVNTKKKNSFSEPGSPSLELQYVTLCKDTGFNVGSDDVASHVKVDADEFTLKGTGTPGLQ